MSFVGDGSSINWGKYVEKTYAKIFNETIDFRNNIVQSISGVKKTDCDSVVVPKPKFYKINNLNNKISDIDISNFSLVENIEKENISQYFVSLDENIYCSAKNKFVTGTLNSYKKPFNNFTQFSFSKTNYENDVIYASRLKKLIEKNVSDETLLKFYSENFKSIFLVVFSNKGKKYCFGKHHYLLLKGSSFYANVIATESFILKYPKQNDFTLKFIMEGTLNNMNFNSSDVFMVFNRDIFENLTVREMVNLSDSSENTSYSLISKNNLKLNKDGCLYKFFVFRANKEKMSFIVEKNNRYHFISYENSPTVFMKYEILDVVVGKIIDEFARYKFNNGFFSEKIVKCRDNEFGPAAIGCEADNLFKENCNLRNINVNFYLNNNKLTFNELLNKVNNNEIKKTILTCLR